MRDNEEIREVQVLEDNTIEIKKTDTRVVDSLSLKREINRAEETMRMMQEEAINLKKNYEREKHYHAELTKALENIEKPSIDELEINLD